MASKVCAARPCSNRPLLSALRRAASARRAPPTSVQRSSSRQHRPWQSGGLCWASAVRATSSLAAAGPQRPGQSSPSSWAVIARPRSVASSSRVPRQPRSAPSASSARSRARAASSRGQTRNGMAPITTTLSSAIQGARRGSPRRLDGVLAIGEPIVGYREARQAPRRGGQSRATRRTCPRRLVGYGPA